MAEWEKALYKVLTTIIEGYPIYNSTDPIEPGKKSPRKYVAITQFTATASSAKQDVASWRVTSTINVYAAGNSKQVSNDMLDDIVTATTYADENNMYELANYICQSVTIGLIEGYPIEVESGEAWQAGTIELVIELQQKYI